MDELKAKLKEAWNENPLGVIALGALVAGTTAKLLNAVSQNRRDRIWEREVSRRERDQMMGRRRR